MHAVAPAPARSSTPSPQAIAPDAVAAPAPPAPSAVLNSPPLDRWSHLPAEVAAQVLYWLMLKESSARSVNALACASKPAHQTVDAFRATSLCQQAEAVLAHRQRAGERVVNYLKSLQWRPRLYTPSELSGLEACLHWLASTGDGLPVSLLISKVSAQNDFAHPQMKQMFQSYAGCSLSLVVTGGESALARASTIAKALPPDVFLRLQLDGGDDEQCAALIRQVSASGRATGLVVMRALSDTPATARALLDGLCSGGFSYVDFDMLCRVESGGFARELIDCIGQMGEARLLKLECMEPLPRADVEALAAALQKRQEAGQSRVTVLLGLPKPLGELYPGTLLARPDWQSQLEQCGLIFGYMLGKTFEDPFVQKLVRSVRQFDADDLGFDDAGVDARLDDSEEGDLSSAPERPQSAVSAADEASGSPRLNNRGKYVVS